MSFAIAMLHGKNFNNFLGCLIIVFPTCQLSAGLYYVDDLLSFGFTTGSQLIERLTVPIDSIAGDIVTFRVASRGVASPKKLGWTKEGVWGRSPQKNFS